MYVLKSTHMCIHVYMYIYIHMMCMIVRPPTQRGPAEERKRNKKRTESRHWHYQEPAA